jgi:hypothetical protein
MPLKKLLKNQSTTIRNRGAISAMIAARHGIGPPGTE